MPLDIEDIIATGNSDYIKKLEKTDIKDILEGKKEIDDRIDKLMLLKVLDIDYLKDVVEGRVKIVADISKLDLISQVAKQEPKYPRDILENNVKSVRLKISEQLDLLMTLHDDNFSKHFFQDNEILGFQSENMDFLVDTFNKLGRLGLGIPNIEYNLFSQEAIDVFGKEQLYDLIKYYKVPGESIGIDNVLEEPDNFNKYSEFRKEIFTEKQVPVMNTYDAIQEFNANFDLINDCIDVDLSDKEKQMFRAVLTEKEVTIKGKEELDNFASIRQEIVSQMSEKDQLTYLLTGMKAEEYNQKVGQYLSQEQLNSTIEDFGEDNPEFIQIRAINETISLISSLNDDERKKVLEELNKELANEFTNEGSSIANMRQAYRDIEVQMQKIYGKELATTLKDVELPKVEHDEEKDVDIIKLEGQEFKMLIHALGAFGAGSGGRFENRELGQSYLCTSLISDKKFAKATPELGSTLYYGFTEIDSNSLVMEGSTDLSTGAKTNSLNIEGNSNKKFAFANDIIDGSFSGGQNEVVLYREYIGEDGTVKKIMPSYVVCFSKEGGIGDKQIEEAKRLNIPIVFIDQEKYEERIAANRYPTNQSLDYKDQLNEKIKAKDVYKETVSQLADIVPALKANEAFKTIVDEMSKTKEQQKEASTYER